LPPPEGQAVVYAGGSRAICQLEKRVHCNGVRPVNQVLLRLDLPNGAPLEDVRELVELPDDWIAQEAWTQHVGIDWQRGGRALGLWVPSAVEPGENNLLLNPDHPAFRSIALTVERKPFTFDDRMFP
jgi:RES domain-containing protein